MAHDDRKLVTLQYARAVAALLVALGHTLAEARKLVPPESALRGASDLFPFQIGVDVFFIISGFIMVYVSQSEKARAGYAGTFLANRIARVVPTYWIYTTLMLIPLILVPSVFDSAELDARQTVFSYLFIPGIGEGVRPVLKLGWTLNYEMFFYAIFAVALFLTRKRAHEVTLGVLVLLAGLWMAGAFGAAPMGFWANPIILEFGAGMVLAHVFFRGIRLPRAATWALILAGLVVAYVTGPMQTNANRVLILGLPALLIVASFALAPAPRNPRALAVVERVGDASYSLYLSHPFVITAVFILWSRLPMAGPGDFLGYVVVTLVIAAVWSVISFHWIEKPASRLVRGWLRGRDKARAATTAP